MRRRITAIVVSLGLITGISIMSTASASAFGTSPGGIEGSLGGAVWSGNYTSGGGGVYNIAT